jgi:hypothetical protein
VEHVSFELSRIGKDVPEHKGPPDHLAIFDFPSENSPVLKLDLRAPAFFSFLLGICFGLWQVGGDVLDDGLLVIGI